MEMAGFETLHSADGLAFDAYVSRPATAPFGAVVVLQEIFGVNSHIRDVADRFAQQGFLAVAPSTFARVQAGVELGYGEQDRAQGMALKSEVDALPAPGVLQDIQTAVDWAARQDVGKVGIVGFCWGGLLAWRAAALLDGLSAAVSYYGGGMTSEAERLRQPQVPVLAHFGRKDHWIALDSVEAFRQVQAGVEVQVYEADHGFHCDQRASYDADAAALAWQRTLAFFRQHLAG